MEIAIFTELTTNESLEQLKVESEKYTGLYVDMNNAKERKYVKDKAADIKALIAKVERKRIDEAADYKVKVEKEAANITERLIVANLPFTLLIDEHTAERKRILDAEKERKAKIEIAVKLEADHEFALLLNSQFDTDKANAERERIEIQQRITKEIEQAAEVKAKQLAQKNIDDAEAAKQQAIDDKVKADNDLIESKANEKRLKEQAEKTRLNNEWLAYISEAYKINDDINSQIQRDYLAGVAETSRLAAIEDERLAGIERQRVAQQKLDDAESARIADVNHTRTINRAIFQSFVDAGLDKNSATIATQALIDNKINHTQINY